MKNKIRIYLMFLAFQFISCASSTSDFTKNLIDKCVWDYFNSKESISANSAYKFDPKGVCTHLEYKFYNQVKTDTLLAYTETDEIRPKNWNIENNFLNIQGVRYHIMHFNKDSIITKLDNGDTVYLIKNCTFFFK